MVLVSHILKLLNDKYRMSLEQHKIFYCDCEMRHNSEETSSCYSVWALCINDFYWILQITLWDRLSLAPYLGWEGVWDWTRASCMLPVSCTPSLYSYFKWRTKLKEIEWLIWITTYKWALQFLPRAPNSKTHGARTTVLSVWKTPMPLHFNCCRHCET